MDDAQLLQTYVRDGSHAAFEAIAKRYVNLVYSAAVRQVADRALAEDVTQAVFLVLARKAAKLADRPNLSGWLLATTHYAARDALRAERRRKRHEARAAEEHTRREAAMPADPHQQAHWNDVAPLLDAAMVRLPEPQRAAVILRVFENRPYDQVAAKLQINEATARQRVSRAIQQLRKLLGKHGAVLSADALAVMMARHAMTTAPPAVTASAAAVATKAVIPARAIAIAHGAAAALVPLGLRAAVVTIVTGLVAATVIVGAIVLHTPRHTSEAMAGGSGGGAPRSPVVTGPITGHVVNPDGQPADGAEVMLARASTPVSIYGPFHSGVIAVTAGPDGAFEFPAVPDATAVVARSDRGGAQILVGDLQSADRVTLVAWARIEGTVRFAGQPLADHDVILGRAGGTLTQWNQWHVMHDARARTDAAGHFVFPRVAVLPQQPPGDWTVRVTDARRGLDASRIVHTEPGRTSAVRIDADARAVAGTPTTRAVLEGKQ